MKYVFLAASCLLASNAIAASTGAGEPVGLSSKDMAYCQAVGGDVIQRHLANGAVNYCLLPDGKHVEGWDLHRVSITND